MRANVLDARVVLGQAAALAGNPPEVLALLANADVSLAASVPLVAASELLDALVPVFPGLQALLDTADLLLPDPNNPGGDPLAPLGIVLQPDERIAADGAFKTPSLRNVALSAPYFHNGGQATLEQVLEFYDRGGDFILANLADAAPDIVPLGFTPAEESSLLAFLRALTFAFPGVWGCSTIAWSSRRRGRPALRCRSGPPARPSQSSSTRSARQ